jgi:branched-chain amino acid transport system ATP-binding protein
MLQIVGVGAGYGKTQVLWDVDLAVNQGEIVALVGSNGSGKTTLLKAISGLLPISSGRVEFLGKQIDGLPPHAIVDLGISQVPEGGRLFPDMSVRENLEMGAYPARSWGRRKEMLERVFRVFPVLKERQRQLAKTLSGGERQMLAIGRALMSGPKLCLLDEPSYGLAPLLIAEVFRIVRTLRDEEVTVLLIEQNVKHTLETADRAYVLESGHVGLHGKCCDLLQTDYVRKAYLGL